MTYGTLAHSGRSKLDGAPGPGSGRYPLGSGERPNQHRGGGASRWFDQNVKGGKDKPNKSRAEIVTDQTKKSIDALKDLNRSVESMANRKKKGASTEGMSDDDLRKAINRMNLERQYADLTKPETAKGFQITRDILEVAGGVAVIASAAATVASTVYMMKHPKNN